MDRTSNDSLSRWKCNLLPATQGRQNILLLHFSCHLVSVGLRDGKMLESSSFLFWKSDELCFVKASPIHMEVKGSRWPLWELLRCCRWRMFHLIHALSLNPEIQTYYSCLKPRFSCLICNIYSKVEVISFWKQEQTLLLPTVTDFLLRPWKMPLF